MCWKMEMSILLVTFNFIYSVVKQNLDYFNFFTKNALEATIFEISKGFQLLMVGKTFVFDVIKEKLSNYFVSMTQWVFCDRCHNIWRAGED